MRALPRVHPDLNRPDFLEKSSFQQLEAFVLELFPGEEVLKKVSARVLCDQIFNAALESIDAPIKARRMYRRRQRIDCSRRTYKSVRAN